MYPQPLKQTHLKQKSPRPIQPLLIRLRLKLPKLPRQKMLLPLKKLKTGILATKLPPQSHPQILKSLRPIQPLKNLHQSPMLPKRQLKLIQLQLQSPRPIQPLLILLQLRKPHRSQHQRNPTNLQRSKVLL